MNTKSKVILCFGMCLLMASFCAVFVFAEEVTVAAETTSAPTLFDNVFAPAEISGYKYKTRTGESWMLDLPASPATSPFTFEINRNGTDDASRYVTVNEGDSFYVVWAENLGKYRLYVNSDVYTLAGFPKSSGATYYASSSTVVTYAGATLDGEAIYDGGGVPVLAKTTFQTGGKLIDFVMSSWVTLIPLVCFLGVVCVGAIKKLLQGV